MKTKFKYIFASMLSICLIAFFCFVLIKKAQAQDTAKNQLVTVREYFTEGKIVIAYGDDKTEIIELENLSPKHYAENTSKLNYVLNKLINNGYSIVTSNGAGGGGQPFLVFNYVLKKN